LRTLERCDLSTLFTAKYSMVFFFRPLYTVFPTQRKKTAKQSEISRVRARAGRIRSRGRSGGGGARRVYRVLASADGLVDVEVVHGGAAAAAAPGG
jgi:hypothetical protein